MPTQLDRAYLATLPTPLDERPLPAVAAPVPALQLLVMGFDPIEQRLLQGTVRLSQRRSPRLVLLDTARQIEILRQVAQGASSKAIARALTLSTKTVETHRAQIMERLGIRDVAGLVRYAVRSGLISAAE